MPKNKLPKQVIDVWPEVLEDVDVKAVPIEYLHSIRVQFADGKIWEIDVQASKDKDFDIEEALEELFEEYEDDISSVDFRVDTERVKSDIQARTASFLKKRK